MDMQEGGYIPFSRMLQVPKDDANPLEQDSIVGELARVKVVVGHILK
jgi:hypothetical protein